MIPENMVDEFMGCMEAMDDDDLPDGAWWAVLQNTADTFAEEKGLKVDGHDLVHHYLDLRQREQERG